MVRLRGRNDADERQQAKTAAEMRLQNRQRRFKPMKKGELRELYQMMFPDYPDIVTVKQLREMLGSKTDSYIDLYMNQIDIVNAK